MLVLSRKPGEEIVVGTDIVIKVMKVRGDKVRIGIEAPRDLPVHRREIYQALCGELRDIRENQTP